MLGQAGEEFRGQAEVPDERRDLTAAFARFDRFREILDATTRPDGAVKLDSSLLGELDEALKHRIDATVRIISVNLEDREPDRAARYAVEWNGLERLRASLELDSTNG
jgi:hypothetical protein